jgi:hypothetical protein
LKGFRCLMQQGPSDEIIYIVKEK